MGGTALRGAEYSKICRMPFLFMHIDVYKIRKIYYIKRKNVRNYHAK